MSPRACLVLGALLGAIGVGLGAFGAHALHDRLEAGGHLATWETAVRYQLAHAVVLLVVALLRDRRGGLAFASWGFVLGTLAFSGSLYLLSLGVLRAVMGPVTPLGGALLIAAWIALALDALRRPSSG